MSVLIFSIVQVRVYFLQAWIVAWVQFCDPSVANSNFEIDILERPPFYSLVHIYTVLVCINLQSEDFLRTLIPLKVLQLKVYVKIKE